MAAVRIMDGQMVIDLTELMATTQEQYPSRIWSDGRLAIDLQTKMEKQDAQQLLILMSSEVGFPYELVRRMLDVLLDQGSKESDMPNIGLHRERIASCDWLGYTEANRLRDARDEAVDRLKAVTRERDEAVRECANEAEQAKLFRAQRDAAFTARDLSQRAAIDNIDLLVKARNDANKEADRTKDLLDRLTEFAGIAFARAQQSYDLLAEDVINAIDRYRLRDHVRSVEEPATPGVDSDPEAELRRITDALDRYRRRQMVQASIQEFTDPGMAERLDRALKVLADLEWNDYGRCPACCWERTRGHEDGCAMAVALGRQEAE